MEKTMILKPRISEKAYGLSQTNNVYVVEVPVSASKQAIAAAMEIQFGVKVETVNSTTLKGKAITTFRKRGRAIKGRRSDVKKAYVKLQDGESLPFFAQEQEADKKAEKAEAK